MYEQHYILISYDQPTWVCFLSQPQPSHAAALRCGIAGFAEHMNILEEDILHW